nr:hypothetical protein [Tanacetum cinerariifolium]
MRTNPRVDTLSFDDLYNNLRVFESDVKGFTASSSSTQNVVFVSSDSTNSTNEVSTTYDVSTSFGHNSQKEDHEDLEQVDEFDLKEMDLKWQLSLTRPKLSAFKCHNTGHFSKECRSERNQESRRRDVGNIGYKARDNKGRPAKQGEHKAMVTIDGEGVNWTGHAKDDIENYALMAFNSINSGSDTKLTTFSKVCEESYAKLKKLYDEQREQLG